MRKILISFALVFVVLTLFSCGASVPQHCPSYSQSYHKITLKKTKGVNKNEFANGIKAQRNYK